MQATIQLLWRRGWLAILFALTLMLISVLPAPSHAQSRSVVVDRRDGVITIQQNGDVEFVETWQVRFIGGPFRFAFREAPLNRSPAGDERHTFTLRYVVEGALQIYEGGRTVLFTGETFDPGNEWEVRVQFPHGVVTATPPLRQTLDDPASTLNLGALAVAVLILLGGSGGLYLLWNFLGKDPHVSVVAATFDVPPDIPPAIAGTLIDERADPREIVATIVDMARRGIVRIEEVGTSGRNFRFVLENADPSLLNAYEQVLIERMFGSRGDSCELSELRESFYEHVSDIKRAIYADCVARGLFPTNPHSTRMRYLGLGWLLLVIAMVSGVGTFVTAIDTVPALLAIPAVLGLLALALMALSNAMPRKTLEGAQQAATMRAFKRYLEQIQKYLNTSEAKTRFESYLPFAIAFGIEKKLVQDFARVDTPAPSWYVPQMDTTTGNVSSGLNLVGAGLISMLNKTSSALISRPVSHSGGGHGDWSDNGGGGNGGGGDGGGGNGGGGDGGGSSGFG